MKVFSFCSILRKAAETSVPNEGKRKGSQQGPRRDEAYEDVVRAIKIVHRHL